jgi:hypothetical protein
MRRVTRALRAGIQSRRHKRHKTIDLQARYVPTCILEHHRLAMAHRKVVGVKCLLQVTLVTLPPRPVAIILFSLQN